MYYLSYRLDAIFDANQQRLSIKKKILPEKVGANLSQTNLN